MPIRHQVPDQTITQMVARQLSTHGIRQPCQVTVQTNKGSVTLTGKIQYEHQRRTIVHAVHSVDGVQRVNDQMKVMNATQSWGEKKPG
jgi:osmotically-inducible protein OsmY